MFVFECKLVRIKNYMRKYAVRKAICILHIYRHMVCTWTQVLNTFLCTQSHLYLALDLNKFSIPIYSPLRPQYEERRTATVDCLLSLSRVSRSSCACVSAFVRVCLCQRMSVYLCMCSVSAAFTSEAEIQLAVCYCRVSLAQRSSRPFVFSSNYH